MGVATPHNGGRAGGSHQWHASACPTTANATLAYVLLKMYRAHLGSPKSVFYEPPRDYQTTLLRLQAAVDRQAHAHGGVKAVVRALASLVAEGLRWTPIGLDLTVVLQSRSRNRPHCALARHWDDVDMLLSTIVFPGGQLSQLFWRCDQPTRLLPGCLASRVNWERERPKLLTGLLSDGFSIVDDWGLDMAALSAQAHAALESFARSRNKSVADDPVISLPDPLPALGPLLSKYAQRGSNHTDQQLACHEPDDLAPLWTARRSPRPSRPT